jgi:hypothetical protein
MVKNRLIGKSSGLHPAFAGIRVLYVGLAFILSERRGAMVNSVQNRVLPQ